MARAEPIAPTATRRTRTRPPQIRIVSATLRHCGESLPRQPLDGDERVDPDPDQDVLIARHVNVRGSSAHPDVAARNKCRYTGFKCSPNIRH